MLKSIIQKQIPDRLYHYTNIESLKSILSNKDGKGICFWAFSNKCKNDDQEIRMGEYMLKRVLNSPTYPHESLLHELSDYENTGSVSFMEGNVNQHMLDVYGHYRLEFDLRDLGVGLIHGGLINCEYVAESELVEYADEYCKMICDTYNSIPRFQNKYGKMSRTSISTLLSFYDMEFDIIWKVFGLKEEKWSVEGEWRKVIKFQDEIHFFNGKPYVNFYLDKKMLKGITVFCSTNTILNAKKDAVDITKYILDRGYEAEVKIVF